MKNIQKNNIIETIISIGNDPILLDFFIKDLLKISEWS